MRRSSGALLCLLALVAVSLAPVAARADGPVDLGASFLADSASLTSGPPVSIAAPTVAGQTIRGQTLSASSGSWNPSATSVTYQWQRDDGSGGGFADIAGATGTTYTLTPTDVGAQLRVHVVATNLAGTGTADALAIGPVLAATPVNTVAPAISGSLVGGRTLTATRGTWSPAGTSYAYQWQRDDGSGGGFADIAGATASTYTTLPADVGADLRAKVTATNPYASTAAITATVGPVTTGRPVSSVAPVISGTPKRGRPLAVTAGTWSPTATTFAFQWQSDDGSGYADIAGATGTAYTPVGADLGLPLRVVVSATNAFGTATAASAATANVATDPPVDLGTPGIAGTPKRGFTLTASAGTWSPAGAAFTYQWQRDDGSGGGFADIAGATAPSYTLVAADVDAVVRVMVTATNVDGSATAASAQTATVQAAFPGNSGAPVVTGAAKVGETLTTTDGGWNPAATSYVYQWQRKVAGSYVDIAGATSKTYVVDAADAGTTVRSKVTGTNADGSAAGFSAPTAAVVAPPIPPSSIAAPTGTLEDTETLTIDGGTWSPSTTTLTYQWLRCPAGATAIGGCVTIGAGKTYTLVGEDVGHTIAVRVTGTVTGASTAVAATLTGDVAGRALTLVGAPAISGTAQVAQTVRALPATWSVPTRSEKYQWRRCDLDGTSNCADIAGATGQSYKVAVADKGRALVVHENVTSWGQSSATDSAGATVVAQPVPSSVAAPAVSGIAARTQNLQASRGTWGNDPTSFAYQWVRCDADGVSGCGPIAGATRANYVLTSADVGHTIAASVTAGNTEGTTTATSPATGVVAAVLPELVLAGPITGKLQVPQTLQVLRSTWRSTADTRYAYQWQRCDADGTGCVDIVGARNQFYRLQTADARSRLRVVTTAINPDGSTSAPTPVTAPIAPAPPGLMASPRLTGVGRADVGKTVTLTPGSWSGSTEIDTKVLEFWRCNPRCAAISTAGAGSYTLTDADAGALIRGSETATGPGGTLVAWASAWIGPVHSATSASAAFAARGGSAMLRTSTGVALASATVRVASGAAVAAAAASRRAAPRDRTA
ncbi:MAG: hypothetical protein JWR63_1621, partial [Conexibacter sp.]|nr:hypothetical protein [Conexibacter sp.]